MDGVFKVQFDGVPSTDLVEAYVGVFVRVCVNDKRVCVGLVFDTIPAVPNCWPTLEVTGFL